MSGENDCPCNCEQLARCQGELTEAVAEAMRKDALLKTASAGRAAAELALKAALGQAYVAAPCSSRDCPNKALHKVEHGIPLHLCGRHLEMVQKHWEQSPEASAASKAKEIAAQLAEERSWSAEARRREAERLELASFAAAALSGLLARKPRRVTKKRAAPSFDETAQEAWQHAQNMASLAPKPQGVPR